MNVCALAWSYTLMQQSDRTLLEVAEQVLRNFGSSNCVVVPRQELRPIPISEVQPRVLSLMKGMCLVLKPAGWEVDSEGHSGSSVCASAVKF